MKKTVLTLLLIHCLAFFASCEGVSAGNPSLPTPAPTKPTSLVGQRIRIIPDAAEEVYLATINDETNASVERIETDLGDQETVNATLSDINTSPFLIDVTFSDGSQVQISVEHDGTTITAVTLTVDGVVVASSFSVESAADGCATGSGNAAIQLVNGVCNAIIFCHPIITCEACRTGVLASNQLTDEFGVPVPEGSLTMQEVADGVGSGTFMAQTVPLNQCLTDMEALTCTDISFGFDSADPTNYDNIENFIPAGVASCEGVFQ